MNLTLLFLLLVYFVFRWVSRNFANLATTQGAEPEKEELEEITPDLVEKPRAPHPLVEADELLIDEGFGVIDREAQASTPITPPIERSESEGDVHTEAEELLGSSPSDLRRAFLASEILRRKY